jgi:hypothetical protein
MTARRRRAQQRRDVTAVVLTMGEAATRSALESVRRQTATVRETLVIRGVSPISRAVNLAVESVRTPFFVQVDADMTLDPDCVERLREAMSPEVGIAAGLLQDPLMGEIGAVKLFRRECFEAVRLRETVATDVDFYREIAGRGWSTLYVLREPRPGRRRTLGEHRPVYSTAYTYATYYLLGARYWQLRDQLSLRWRLHRLRASKHLQAAVARVALGHGLFSDEARDVPKETVQATAGVLRRLVRPDRVSEPGTSALPVPTTRRSDRLRARFYEEGRALAARGAYADFQRRLRGFAAGPRERDAWDLEVSLSHGFLSRLEGDVAAPQLSRLGELR